MMDLTGEVSSGAVDMAKSNLEKMLVRILLQFLYNMLKVII